MNSNKNIAVVFDFDHTLTDDSTELFLNSKGIEPHEFWNSTVNKMVADGWDPSLAWTSAFCDLIGKSEPFGLLTEDELYKFGATVEFYPGVDELFSDLRAIGNSYPKLNCEVEIYIISGGIEPLLCGSSIANQVDGIRACTFATNKAGVIKRPKRVVTFTEKTRFLFEISKGLLRTEQSHPFAVNQAIENSERRVPMENMIYLGDGLTDVPAFSVVKQRGGVAFAVVNPTDDARRSKAWRKLVQPRRVTNVFEPRYGRGDMLGAFLREGVHQIYQRLESSQS